MEFLQQLGFDPIMLGAQILNFLIIFYLLKRFLYKPVLDMIKKREDAIKTGLKQAEDAAAALENATAQEKRILENANTKAKIIIEEARNHSLQISKDMEEKAKAQTEKIIMDAKTRINLEAQEIEKSLSSKVGILAQDILIRSLKGIFSAKEQKTIVERALKSLKRVD